jgi:hypothetical protein
VIVTDGRFSERSIGSDASLPSIPACRFPRCFRQGMPPCSADTGAYARARQRLPEALLAVLTRQTGAAADRAALDPWRWLGRTVKLFDGSTVSMPDTPKNQAAYPQSRAQAPGVGFPLARIGVLFSLSLGTVLDLGIRRWAGKFQSELAMLRPAWMSRKQYAAIPATLSIREFPYRIVRPGYRQRTIVVATTLLSDEQYSMADIAKLYRLRWDAEINLCSLKTMMNMDVLRCQPPEMVRKEIWAHLLAYNLIRTVIAQAAANHDKHPRQISFTRAMRTLEAFRSPLAHTPNRQLAMLYEHMLQAIAAHEIAHRPNRLEPRQRKRRPKPYDLMTKPRPQARKLEAKTR